MVAQIVRNLYGKVSHTKVLGRLFVPLYICGCAQFTDKILCVTVNTAASKYCCEYPVQGYRYSTSTCTGIGTGTAGTGR